MLLRNISNRFWQLRDDYMLTPQVAKPYSHASNKRCFWRHHSRNKTVNVFCIEHFSLIDDAHLPCSEHDAAIIEQTSDSATKSESHSSWNFLLCQESLKPCRPLPSIASISAVVISIRRSVFHAVCWAMVCVDHSTTNTMFANQSLAIGPSAVILLLLKLRQASFV